MEVDVGLSTTESSSQNSWTKELMISLPSSSSVAPGRATKNGSEGTAPSSCQFFAFFSTKSICNWIQESNCSQPQQT